MKYQALFYQKNNENIFKTRLLQSWLALYRLTKAIYRFVCDSLSLEDPDLQFICRILDLPINVNLSAIFNEMKP